ncbi:hypothetical protein GCM10027200_16800 [Lentzea nigeriaca]
MRGISALAGAITFAGSLLVTPAHAAAPFGVDPQAMAAAEARATQVSELQQRLAAASTLNEQVTPTQVRMTDLNFTIWIWEAAGKKNFTAIKREAQKAFLDEVNEVEVNASYRFITEGIFPAYREDVRNLANQSDRVRERIAAAELIGWMPLEEQYKTNSLESFVIRLYTLAPAGSEIKAKAAEVLTATSTDADRQKYITQGIIAAFNLDNQRRREAEEQAQRARDEKQANDNARILAWQVVARPAIPDELKNITDFEFTHEISRKALGKHVINAAQVALDSRDAAKIKAFIFTGIHTAHQADVAEENARDAAETEKRIKEILDDGRRDGYLPEIVAAATTALAGDLTARHSFINLGFSEAVKRDLAKPKNELVIELQGKASGRCVQIAGMYEQAIENGQYNELWDCVRGPKQVWTMKQVGTNEYMLRNLNSLQCLDGYSEFLRQNPCDTNNNYHKWTFVENTDGSFQIKNVGTGKFVTAKDGGTPNATNVISYSNTNDGHQRWRVIDLAHRSDATQIAVRRYQLKGVQSGRCLQTAGLWDTPNQGALANLANQEIWDCVGGDKMAWDLVDLGGKRYALKNVMSGKCLDVKYGGWANGTQLIQYECHYGDSEQFVFSAEPDGSFVLESALTGKAADVWGNAVQNGAWVAIQDTHRQGNQRWTLVSA